MVKRAAAVFVDPTPKTPFSEVCMQAMKLVAKLNEAGSSASVTLSGDDKLALRLPPKRTREYEDTKQVDADSQQWEYSTFLQMFENELVELEEEHLRVELLRATLKALTKEQRGVLLESLEDGSLERLLRYSTF